VRRSVTIQRKRVGIWLPSPESSPDAGKTSAADLFALVPAVGQGGNSVKLQTFAEQLAGVGRDGIRGVL